MLDSCRKKVRIGLKVLFFLIVEVESNSLPVICLMLMYKTQKTFNIGVLLSDDIV